LSNLNRNNNKTPQNNPKIEPSENKETLRTTSEKKPNENKNK
jgi:hypothetical protein